MTDNEIIKALEIHANRGECGECAYGELPSCNCQMQMFKDCFDLINRQQAAIEWLREQRDSYMQDATDFSIEVDKQKAEIERLEAMIDAAEEHFAPLPFKNKFDEYIEKSKAEAIKEFAERLNEEAEKVCIDREGDFVEADGEIYDTVADWCKKTSDNIVKEAVKDDFLKLCEEGDNE